MRPVVTRIMYPEFSAAALPAKNSFALSAIRGKKGHGFESRLHGFESRLLESCLVLSGAVDRRARWGARECLGVASVRISAARSGGSAGPWLAAGPPEKVGARGRLRVSRGGSPFGAPARVGGSRGRHQGWRRSGRSCARAPRTHRPHAALGRAGGVRRSASPAAGTRGASGARHSCRSHHACDLLLSWRYSFTWRGGGAVSGRLRSVLPSLAHTPAQEKEA
jgi:hypothetical protein